MKILIDTLLSIGYLPCVIPEFKQITVGGAVSGFGIETTSFKYGLFHETVIEYECLSISDLKIINITNKNEKLFYAIPGSLNTLGIIILLMKIKIIKSKKYVKIEYNQIDDNKFLNKMYKIINDKKKNYDFIEGIRNFNNTNKFIIGKGKLVDTINGDYFSMKYPWHHIYYHHISNKFNNIKYHDGYIEYMDIYDYLFRHDRYCFWAAVQGMNLNANNLLFRILFGWLLDSKSVYSYRNRLNIKSEEGQEMRLMAQDLIVTENGFNKFYNFINKHYPNGPIWFCPLKVPNNKYIFTPIKDDNYNKKSRFAINIGLWLKNKNFNKWYDCYKVNKLLELQCSITGFKWYYSNSYLNKKEFYNQVFNNDNNDNISKYFEIRKELKCDKFNIPTIYEKCGKLGNKYKDIDENFTINWMQLDPVQYQKLLKKNKKTTMDKIKKFTKYINVFMQIKLTQLKLL